MKNVFKLEDSKEQPDGYKVLQWQRPPYQGLYAIKPRADCKECNGTGIMIIKLYNVATEHYCNCVHRRLSNYLNPKNISKRKTEDKELKNKWVKCDNEKLEQEIQRVQKLVDKWGVVVEPLKEKRDQELKELDERMSNLKCDISDLIDLKDSFMSIKELLEKKAKQTMIRARQKAEQLNQQADNYENGFKEIQKEINRLTMESLQDQREKIRKKWVKKITEVGGGKARRDFRRLKKLTERLKSRQEEEETK